MQLRRDHYKDTKVCPICKGAGVLNPEKSSYDFEYCDECEGFGTYIDEEKGRVVFGLPLFVDYPTRKKLRIAKIVGWVLLTIVFLVVVMVIM